MPAVVLLGPQRLQPTLVRAVDDLGVRGTVAAVTAGWEEREDEIDELSAHLRRTVVNLGLFRRGEDVFRKDPELLLATGDWLDRRQRLHDLYRKRLAHALVAVRDLQNSGADRDLVDEEVEAAVDAVRRLDAEHRERVRRLRLDFERTWTPLDRPAVAAHRKEIASILSSTSAFALAGGHVAVLLDRLRLFDVASLLPEDAPVFAWSAGAMVAGEAVVLFHDDPPEGPGSAEVFDAGLSIHRDVLPFPHARRRLKLEDPDRVALLARRFAPLRCVALDEGSRVDWRAKRDLRFERARELLPTGEVSERGAA